MTKMATREAYGKALAKLIVENPNVVVLDADLTKSTKTVDAKVACPQRHFNMGIAEGNMMAVAAGLAASNKIVYASSFAMFAAGRAFEQIRNSICYPKLNVKICGTHAGLTVGEDGASHQAIEDIALMRAIPNMTVIQPSDDIETFAVIDAISKVNGPVYVRLGRAAVDTVHDESNYVFQLGKADYIKKGKKIAMIATGVMVQESLKALDIVKSEGIEPTLVNMHTIKPIDEQCIIDLAKTHDVIMTLEEHNVIGGLGSAVAEVLVKHEPKKVVMIGVQDTFGESGKPQQLLEKYNLSKEYIVEELRKLR